MTVFWILGYLAVGFVVAVLVERYVEPWPDHGAVLGGIVFFPATIIASAVVLFGHSASLLDCIRWCARRLP